ncbi:hypothetical protein HAP47_0022220 [Bradyrhizobium sp. 41S5]|uniref:hypothetical protein n=1 Tax=Bradyrhizobium sp. 41S5 TaxID=1404443 RepID=UPI00156B266E|nr:hypothetical protein [Bradyrhizobium sp. 41S5]UFX42010.1 hypothetical protein HAP47_0022220 [Bradyrhizobium sp. 41S5]
MNRRALLKPREAAVLARLAADGAMTALEIGQASGLYPNGRPATWAEFGRLLVQPLLRAGAVTKAGRKPLLDITERGRIAIALFRAIANRKGST